MTMKSLLSFIKQGAWFLFDLIASYSPWLALFILKVIRYKPEVQSHDSN